jgi:putative hemolysin
VLNWSFWVPIVILAVSCFYATSYFSLRSLSRIKLEEILVRKNKLLWLEYLQDHLNNLVLICSVIRTAANLAMVSAFVWVIAHGTLTLPVLVEAFFISLILLSVFSVGVPHAWAKYAGESFLAVAAPVLYGTEKACYPLLKFFHVVDVCVRRMLGVGIEQEEEQAQQEILEAVQEGEDEGVVDTQERKMIESVIELRSTSVGQIMTPRTEIIAIDAGTPLEELKRVIMEQGHSRMPVFSENLDNIVGMLYVKDLLRFIGEKPETFDIRQIMRACYFVPETKNLRDIFREFRGKKLHVAIVLDEYGGTLGMITFEDAIEQIVGQIADEYELSEPPMIRQLDSKTLEADGRMRIDELNEEYKFGVPESEDYETISGFLFSSLGRIPSTGESFQFQNLRFSILDATERKINRVRVEILPAGIHRPEEKP